MNRDDDDLPELRAFSTAAIFGFSSFEEREKHIATLGYVHVTEGLVAALKPYCIGRTVEVMAGVGHLASQLRAAGVTLEASDDFSWHKPRGWKPVTTVIKRDAVKAAVGADTVIMLWPYMDDTAHRVALAMKPGASLIYCGEDGYGCNADEKFFELVETWQEDKAFEKAVNRQHKQWPGLHDYWRRFNKPEA